MISVIIPFLNPGVFLEEAIQSVLAQSYADWELLLVDDGSSDGSCELARSYAVARPDNVFYLEHAGHTNRGAAASRNLGIRHARGEYVAFLDADDVWLPDKLRAQEALLKTNRGVTMTYGPAINWSGWRNKAGDTNCDTVQLVGVTGERVVPPPNLLLMFLKSSDLVPSPSGVLVSKEAAISVGGFSERFRGTTQIYDDQAFYAKLLVRNSVLVTDTPCYQYRLHEDSCCAKVTRDGTSTKLRIDFLQWLSSYLAQTCAEDLVTRGLVADELRKLRAERNHSTIGKAARRILPPAVRHWLRSWIARSHA